MDEELPEFDRDVVTIVLDKDEDSIEINFSGVHEAVAIGMCMKAALMIASKGVL